ncbi:MAG: type ISP restriction/modification enzyme, partial [Candidatus Hydrogenedentota bacterium]
DIPRSTRFPASGSNTVEKVWYVEPQQRVYINGVQYFEGVPKDIWEFHVGGYQVCQKWLNDRKNRTLTYDDLQTYQYIVAALGETQRLMEQIDQTIDAHGGWPIE